jgi:hypothetical protein
MIPNYTDSLSGWRLRCAEPPPPSIEPAIPDGGQRPEAGPDAPPIGRGVPATEFGLDAGQDQAERPVAAVSGWHDCPRHSLLIWKNKGIEKATLKRKHSAVMWMCSRWHYDLWFARRLDEGDRRIEQAAVTPRGLRLTRERHAASAYDFSHWLNFGLYMVFFWLVSWFKQLLYWWREPKAGPKQERRRQRIADGYHSSLYNNTKRLKVTRGARDELVRSVTSNSLFSL